MMLAATYIAGTVYILPSQWYLSHFTQKLFSCYEMIYRLHANHTIFSCIKGLILILTIDRLRVTRI